MNEVPENSVTTIHSKEENGSLTDSKKLVIRLSRRNKLMEQATRRHYASNPDVVFIYEEDEILEDPDYWVTIAQRANIPIHSEHPSDTFRTSVNHDANIDVITPNENKSLLESLQERFKAYKQMSKNEEDAYYANIEREYKLQKERAKQTEHNDTVRKHRISRLFEQLKENILIVENKRSDVSEHTIKSEITADEEITTGVLEKRPISESSGYSKEGTSEDSIIILSDEAVEALAADEGGKSSTRDDLSNGSNVESESFDSDSYPSEHISVYDDDDIDDHRGSNLKYGLTDRYRNSVYQTPGTRGFGIQDIMHQNLEENELSDDTGEEGDRDEEESEESRGEERIKEEDDDMEDNTDISLENYSEEISSEVSEKDLKEDTEITHGREYLDEEENQTVESQEYSISSPENDYMEEEVQNYTYDDNQTETVDHDDQSVSSNKEVLNTKDNATESIYHDFYLQEKGNTMSHKVDNYVTLDSDSENFASNSNSDNNQGESSSESHVFETGQEQQKLDSNDVSYAYELAKLSQQYQNDIDMIVNGSLKDVSQAGGEDIADEGQASSAPELQGAKTEISSIVDDSHYMTVYSEIEELSRSLPEESTILDESIVDKSIADPTLFFSAIDSSGVHESTPALEDEGPEVTNVRSATTKTPSTPSTPVRTIEFKPVTPPSPPTPDPPQLYLGLAELLNASLDIHSKQSAGESIEEDLVDTAQKLVEEVSTAVGDIESSKLEALMSASISNTIPNQVNIEERHSAFLEGGSSSPTNEASRENLQLFEPFNAEKGLSESQNILTNGEPEKEHFSIVTTEKIMTTDTNGNISVNVNDNFEVEKPSQDEGEGDETEFMVVKDAEPLKEISPLPDFIQHADSFNALSESSAFGIIGEKDEENDTDPNFKLKEESYITSLLNETLADSEKSSLAPVSGGVYGETIMESTDELSDADQSFYVSEAVEKQSIEKKPAKTDNFDEEDHDTSISPMEAEDGYPLADATFESAALSDVTSKRRYDEISGGELPATTSTSIFKRVKGAISKISPFSWYDRSSSESYSVSEGSAETDSQIYKDSKAEVELQEEDSEVLAASQSSSDRLHSDAFENPDHIISENPSSSNISDKNDTIENNIIGKRETNFDGATPQELKPDVHSSEGSSSFLSSQNRGSLADLNQSDASAKDDSACESQVVEKLEEKVKGGINLASSDDKDHSEISIGYSEAIYGTNEPRESQSEVNLNSDESSADGKRSDIKLWPSNLADALVKFSQSALSEACFEETDVSDNLETKSQESSEANAAQANGHEDKSAVEIPSFENAALKEDISTKEDLSGDEMKVVKDDREIANYRKDSILNNNLKIAGEDERASSTKFPADFSFEPSFEDSVERQNNIKDNLSHEVENQSVFAEDSQPRSKLDNEENIMVKRPSAFKQLLTGFFGKNMAVEPKRIVDSSPPHEREAESGEGNQSDEEDSLPKSVNEPSPQQTTTTNEGEDEDEEKEENVELSFDSEGEEELHVKVEEDALVVMKEDASEIAEELALNEESPSTPEEDTTTIRVYPDSSSIDDEPVEVITVRQPPSDDDTENYNRTEVTETMTVNESSSMQEEIVDELGDTTNIVVYGEDNEEDISNIEVGIVKAQKRGRSEEVGESSECIGEDEEQSQKRLHVEDSKLFVPPVAVRTRSRSPSRKSSESSQRTLSTEEGTKTSINVIANRVLSYGSDDDPVELNEDQMPRIYPNLVEEADYFIEHDAEKKPIGAGAFETNSDNEEEKKENEGDEDNEEINIEADKTSKNPQIVITKRKPSLRDTPADLGSKRILRNDDVKIINENVGGEASARPTRRTRSSKAKSSIENEEPEATQEDEDAEATFEERLKTSRSTKTASSQKSELQKETPSRGRGRGRGRARGRGRPRGRGRGKSRGRPKKM